MRIDDIFRSHPNAECVVLIVGSFQHDTSIEDQSLPTFAMESASFGCETVVINFDPLFSNSVTQCNENLYVYKIAQRLKELTAEQIIEFNKFTDNQLSKLVLIDRTSPLTFLLNKIEKEILK